jgi:hypothetical protein
MTAEELKNSPEFKQWITGRVSLIHNTYWDAKEPFYAYIVLHSEMGKWTITRFWKSPNMKDQVSKMQVSVDYTNISTDEVFGLLLTKYSRGLA